MANRILVVDRDPIYQNLTTAILSRGKHELIIADSVATANELLTKEAFKLALIDLSIFKENITLSNNLRRQQIPFIVTTDENVDIHFEFIVTQKLNLVLNKPFKSQELLNVVEMLLNPNEGRWFGLHNYLQSPSCLKRIELNNSLQIRTAINTVFTEVESWGFLFDMKFEMDLVWQEILTNALYHSHGYSRYKRERIPIRLPHPYKVVVRFGSNEHQFGISIRDFRGTLSPERVLESLQTSVEQQQMLERALHTGEEITDKILDRGRGLDIIRKMTGEYYFIIDPGKSTEIIIIYDRNYEKDDPYSSIKVFELPNPANRLN